MTSELVTWLQREAMSNWQKGSDKAFSARRRARFNHRGRRLRDASQVIEAQAARILALEAALDRKALNEVSGESK